MKKIIVTILVLFVFMQGQAQVTFKPGIRGGANFAHFTKTENYYVDNQNNEDFSSKTDFYIGFYGALKLTKYYMLQPEFNYSIQGSNYKYTDDNNATISSKIDISYLSVCVLNKFNFNEKLNVQIGPTIDFILDQSQNVNVDTNSEVDIAFTAGLGYNFTKNFGIEARIKKGFIPVVYTLDSDHTNVVYSIGATYTFDLK